MQNDLSLNEPANVTAGQQTMFNYLLLKVKNQGNESAMEAHTNASTSQHQT